MRVGRKGVGRHLREVQARGRPRTRFVSLLQQLETDESQEGTGSTVENSASDGATAARFAAATSVRRAVSATRASSDVVNDDRRTSTVAPPPAADRATACPVREPGYECRAVWLLPESGERRVPVKRVPAGGAVRPVRIVSRVPAAAESPSRAAAAAATVRYEAGSPSLRAAAAAGSDSRGSIPEPADLRRRRAAVASSRSHHRKPGRRTVRYNSPRWKNSVRTRSRSGAARSGPPGSREPLVFPVDRRDPGRVLRRRALRAFERGVISNSRGFVCRRVLERTGVPAAVCHRPVQRVDPRFARAELSQPTAAARASTRSLIELAVRARERLLGGRVRLQQNAGESGSISAVEFDNFVRCSSNRRRFVTVGLRALVIVRSSHGLDIDLSLLSDLDLVDVVPVAIRRCGTGRRWCRRRSALFRQLYRFFLWSLFA